MRLVYTQEKGLVEKLQGEGVELNGNIVDGAYKKVFYHTATSGNTVLTVADSGCVVSVSANAAAQKILVPLATAAPGFRFSVTLTGVPVNDLDIEETTTTNNFITINNVGGSNTDGLTGNQTLRIDVSAPTVAGDMLECYSDGVNYIVHSQTASPAGILAV